MKYNNFYYHNKIFFDNMCQKKKQFCHKQTKLYTNNNYEKYKT